MIVILLQNIIEIIHVFEEYWCYSVKSKPSIKDDLKKKKKSEKIIFFYSEKFYSQH